MASSLLRRRFSNFSVSRHIYDKFESFPLEFKLGLLACQCDCSRQFSSGASSTGFDFTDLTRPHTWYPIARKKKRTVYLHVGPTNSGKTYQALKQLECSSTGVYCGPLRLLAWEVAKRLNKANVPCDLITGQEREEVEGAKHMAATVEMADVASDYQCAIIDEIQMLGCRTRGFSFTRALLGLAADELHLCGDPAAVPLIKEILKVTGDNLQIKYYDRLSPLEPSKVPLGSFKNIKKGDCIVTFSRRQIYNFKRKIENEGNHLCSVVYGSLPPETRTRQAKIDDFTELVIGMAEHVSYLNVIKCFGICNTVDDVKLSCKEPSHELEATMFNDATSEFDVLVASDAIGMGLNLNISRIIFSTLQKFDGQEMRDLTVPEIKQIAGRAGRFGSKYPVGEVTCLNKEDLPLLHSSINSPSPDLERAGLFPSYDLLLMYSRANPQDGLYQILEHFSINSKLASNYFMSNCEELLGLRLSVTIGVLDILASDLYNCWHAKRDEKVAAIIDELPLGLREKYIFCISPVDVDDDISSQGLVQFAQTYAKKGIVNLREIFTPGTLKVPKTPAAMQELESIHKVLELYVWLSYRLDDSFPDREMAASQKSICSMLIEEFLEQYGWQQPQFKKKLTLSKSSLLSLYKRPQL